MRVDEGLPSRDEVSDTGSNDWRTYIHTENFSGSTFDQRQRSPSTSEAAGKNIPFSPALSQSSCLFARSSRSLPPAPRPVPPAPRPVPPAPCQAPPVPNLELKTPYYSIWPATLSTSPQQQCAYAHTTSGKVKIDAPIYFDGRDAGWVTGITSHVGRFVILEIYIHDHFTNVIFHAADVDFPLRCWIDHMRKWAMGPKVRIYCNLNR
ncbi:hypothetical protein VNI00_016473 [Paramarasmius palmivorus]|uniref:Uncharacterized protein n=1 Tax=Paramarasmius palmivorus TaxID=297713 RepID=A0AAW0BET0_9AGAR